MKNKNYLLAALAFMFICLQSRAQDDKALIKSVIEQETSSFFRLDSVAWKSYWLNAPYTYWTYSDSNGGTSVEGTENIYKNFKEYFKTAKPSKSKIERNWIEVKIYGNGAYARFNQRAVDELDQDETSEIRVLEKDKGKWKIICMSATSTTQQKK